MFTESLTVRILGDSSDLQRELEAVTSQLDDLQSRLADTGAGARTLAEGLGSASESTGPLRQVSTQLTAVSRQVAQLNGQSISLNVQPALVALAQLSSALQAVMAQMMQLAALGSVGTAAVGGLPTRMSGSALGAAAAAPPRLSTPALWPMISTRLGTETGTRPLAAPVRPINSTPNATTNNHFGGITIQVTEPGSVNDVMRDLRLQGAALRVRRG